ncbi:hypothetical protein [Methylobacterium sp. ARG-1]|uniref:hypothetical protein n=1 Tax=Methylobacterium sp. ARG-1 TaxID=1692501 RepID=UPI000682F88B|nr:hypothetical protein [Methylobacterium sp. ARG-1]KNY20757.1 hypothetical protein AKJ13_20905 [Methylobacterium sp. ARG-1]
MTFTAQTETGSPSGRSTPHIPPTLAAHRPAATPHRSAPTLAAQALASAPQALALALAPQTLAFEAQA